MMQQPPMQGPQQPPMQGPPQPMGQLQERQPDPFNAAIPGSSLTAPPGSSPWEQPAKYSDPQEAVEATFDLMVKKGDEIALQLKAGLPAEAIARNVLFAGFNKGMFTPDTALLISNIVLGQVVAIGMKMGLTGMKLANPRAQVDTYKSQLMDLANQNGGIMFKKDPVEEQSDFGFTSILGQ